MTTTELLTDALATIHILGWAFAGWLAIFALVGTIIILTITATGTWAAKALWRGVAGPSWARSALRARIHARHRVRPSESHTGDPHFEEAA